MRQNSRKEPTQPGYYDDDKNSWWCRDVKGKLGKQGKRPCGNFRDRKTAQTEVFLGCNGDDGKGEYDAGKT